MVPVCVYAAGREIRLQFTIRKRARDRARFFLLKKGVPQGGSWTRGGLMRGKVIVATRYRAIEKPPPLIRRFAPPSPSGEGIFSESVRFPVSSRSI